ncbi:hypothetical protein BGZ46_001909 [Entomortierella lignicola]|nr:hypothetical protein BGZ46_001909 [Entomortierella lignicola]
MDTQLEQSTPQLYHKQSIWDLPELVSHVALFLTQHQLAQAVTVCKSWNSALTPLLYSNTEWSSKTLLSVRNANYIKHLYYYGWPEAFSSEAISRLEVLEMWYNSDELQEMLDLIRRNPQLYKITVRADEPIEAALQALLECRNLRKLELDFKELSLEVIQGISNIRTHLQELKLVFQFGIHFPGKWTLFPTLTSLDLTIHNLSGLEQLKIIESCPQLRSLTWFMRESYFPIEEFCELFSTSCPLLENLQLEMFLRNDHVLQILDSCPKVTKLLGPKSRVDSVPVPTAISSLMRHSQTLTAFDIYGMKSEMIHRILISCPLLTILKTGGVFRAHHILGVNEDLETDVDKIQLCPVDWVCINLQTVKLRITGLEDKPSEWNMAVIHQLSRLKQLQELDVRLDSRPGRGLDLRLGFGLESLESLRELRDFKFEDLGEMNTEDARWMVQAWPKLTNIYGMIFLWSTSKKIEEVFQEHNSIPGTDEIDFYFDYADDDSYMVSDSGDDDTVE